MVIVINIKMEIKIEIMIKYKKREQISVIREDSDDDAIRSIKDMNECN